MSKLMGFFLGRGTRPGGLLPPPQASHEQTRGRPRRRGTRPGGLLPPPLRRPHEQAHGSSHRRPLPTPLKTMGGVLAVCDGRR